MLFGRHCLTFGSSRVSDFRLGKMADIDDHHFFVQFEKDTGDLVLTDCSESGTWVRRASRTAHTLLRGDSVVLCGTTDIRIGQGQGCELSIGLTDLVTDRDSMRGLLDAHSKSLSRFKRKRNSCARVGRVSKTRKPSSASLPGPSRQNENEVGLQEVAVGAGDKAAAEASYSCGKV